MSATVTHSPPENPKDREAARALDEVHTSATMNGYLIGSVFYMIGSVAFTIGTGFFLADALQRS